MYAPSYDRSLGMDNIQQPMNIQQQPFNPNGGRPQHPHQPQPAQQPMMYNPLAYGGGAPHSPYGAPGPGMGGNAGAMGMMQNSGLAHMPAGQMAQYQTPYTSSPYGISIPTSSSSNIPQNYTPTTSNAPSFPMNAPNMNMQQNRMQPPPTSSTPTQRQSPYGNMQQNTPPNAGPQSQFSTPQGNQQIQTSNLAQGSGGTPQTPTFPAGTQPGPQVMATPLSPGSEAREKERVTLLLEINSSLLQLALGLQTLQNADKEKETKLSEGGEVDPAEKEKLDKAKAQHTKEYFECMRRLQSNLAYLAAIADRSHKPSSQIPPHPAVMSAPTLTARSDPTPSTTSTSPPKTGESSAPTADASKSDASKDTNKKEEVKEISREEDEKRIELLKDQYRRLQALFPGVDPKKDTMAQAANAAAAMRAKAQAQAQAQAMAQGGGQAAAGGAQRQGQGQAGNNAGQFGNKVPGAS